MQGLLKEWREVAQKLGTRTKAGGYSFGGREQMHKLGIKGCKVLRNQKRNINGVTKNIGQDLGTNILYNWRDYIPIFVV